MTRVPSDEEPVMRTSSRRAFQTEGKRSGPAVGKGLGRVRKESLKV
jgi:hypothetical protein